MKINNKDLAQFLLISALVCWCILAMVILYEHVVYNNTLLVLVFSAIVGIFILIFIALHIEKGVKNEED